MNNEEFIIKFYACDNQEQFLKDVCDNLNCLQNQVEKLIQENNDLEERVIHQDNLIKGLHEEIEHLKQPQIFIDTEDMEERYENDLYVEYLEKENKHLQNVIGKTIGLIYDCQMNDECNVHYKELLEILRSKE